MSGGARTKDGDLEALARRLGHDFAEPDLLRHALSHPSIITGRAARNTSYQRLEFLGDRVLGLVVAELLYRRFPNEAEGDLARRLAALVRQDSLARVAEALDLGPHLRLAKAEEEAGGRLNPALLADACEAVIGALYLDGGLEAARALIEPRWTPLLEAEASPPQDAKTALQEWAQGRGLPLPLYREVARAGPDHEPLFTVEVAVEGRPAAQGEGRSKRLAEQAAASALLERLTGANS
ncbi:MAG: ribonuclease III [Kiloniellales bacterium]